MAEKSVAVDGTNARPVFITELVKAKLPATVTATPEQMLNFHDCDQDRAWVVAGA